MAEQRGFLAELGRRNVLRAGMFPVAAVWALAPGIAQPGTSVGLPDAATIRRAIALDPSSDGRYNLATQLIVLQRYDEAEATFRKALESQPQGAQTRACLSIVRMLQGQAAEAVVMASLVAGNADDAGFHITIVQARRGQADEMFRWREHARATGDPGVQDALQIPLVDPYFDDPRFPASLESAGLPPPPARRLPGHGAS